MTVNDGKISPFLLSKLRILSKRENNRINNLSKNRG